MIFLTKKCKKINFLTDFNVSRETLKVFSTNYVYKKNISREIKFSVGNNFFKQISEENLYVFFYNNIYLKFIILMIKFYVYVLKLKKISF